MNYRYAFLMFFGAFIIQTTVLKHFAILGVSPDLLLVLVIVCAFLFTEHYGAVCGLALGIVQDICFSATIGVSALGYFLVAVFITEIKRFVYRENLLSTLFLVAASTLMYGFLYWGALRIFEGNYALIQLVVKLPALIVYHYILTLACQDFMIKKVIRYRGDRYI